MKPKKWGTECQSLNRRPDITKYLVVHHLAKVENKNKTKHGSSLREILKENSVFDISHPPV